MLIPKLPREPNLSPTRFLYGIWQNLLGNYNGKIPNLPTNDPNVAPTPLLHAIWKQTQGGGGRWAARSNGTRRRVPEHGRHDSSMAGNSRRW